MFQVPGLSSVKEIKAQIGLGHGYSRMKVKFNVNRADNMIIQVRWFCYEYQISNSCFAFFFIGLETSFNPFVSK